jgi:hypothetical protein
MDSICRTENEGRNQTKNRVRDDESLCLETSTKNAGQEFHLWITRVYVWKPRLKMPVKNFISGYRFVYYFSLALILSGKQTRARIFKLLRSPGIDYKE